jgi:hypothetical protein
VGLVGSPGEAKPGFVVGEGACFRTEKDLVDHRKDAQTVAPAIAQHLVHCSRMISCEMRATYLSLPGGTRESAAI